MDKITKTIFLLILIALSMQIYISNHQGYSEKTMGLAVPIIMNVFLFLIWIFHLNDSEYANAIGKVFVWFAIISGIYCAIFLYFMALGGAYKN